MLFNGLDRVHRAGWCIPAGDEARQKGPTIVLVATYCRDIQSSGYLAVRMPERIRSGKDQHSYK